VLQSSRHEVDDCRSRVKALARLGSSSLLLWTSTDRPRSEAPDDRFAMAEEASAARYVRLLIVVQGGRL